MPGFGERAQRNAGANWNILTFFEQYVAASQVVVDNTGTMMWEALWMEKSKLTEYGIYGKAEAESMWKECGALEQCGQEEGTDQ